MRVVAVSAALWLASLGMLGCGTDAEAPGPAAAAGWPTWGGEPGGGHFSPLREISPSNVADLEVAWVHHTGDLTTGDGDIVQGSFQATPVLLGDALYFCTPRNRVIALDAESGEERWRFDPQITADQFKLLACRGVTTWTDGLRKQHEACARRVFTATIDARLIALDASTGTPCDDFGEQGQVDLASGIGGFDLGEYGVTSPPTVFRDLVVVGSLVFDNLRIDAPGGVVRAFNARTGALAWAWDPVPETEPGATAHTRPYRRGTANAWSVLSVDAASGVIFVPTGNAAPDYYGALRDGLDAFSSSVVALDGTSGRPIWHFQTVHHDLWDYDVPAQPTLLNYVLESGESIPALVQSTKMGHLFLLDRRNGEPLFAVEERNVPGGAVPGETLSPTQPFPTFLAAVHPPTLRPEDAWGLTPWDRGACRSRLESMRNDGLFTPPSLEGSVQFPGAAGGPNWGGVAVDPERRLLVVNTMRMATFARLIPREEYVAMEREGPLPPSFEPQAGTPYGLERGPILSPMGVPCNPPPWGTLAAVDLASGSIRWEIPLGSTRDLVPWPFWFEWGVPNLGGPLMTGSGVTFIAATTDNFLRAFDSESGELLWKGRLPAGGQATPMTYRARAGGRQLVVIAAGGHGILGTTPGDALVAFALP